MKHVKYFLCGLLVCSIVICIVGLLILIGYLLFTHIHILVILFGTFVIYCIGRVFLEEWAGNEIL